MVVISRNTAFTYRDKSADLEQIGRELNVRYVLEGSIRRAGNRVVADAQLMEAETGEGIWAERFEHETDDLFALQDEVTGRIAVALNLQIVSAEAARATGNPDTLDYILRGRAVLNRGATRQNFAEAMDLFANALAIDRGCDQAKALIAGALVGRVLNQLSDAAAADLEQAQALIAEAQFSSASPSLVHFIKGQILRAQCRYQAAIPEYEATLALDRNAAPAFAALGQCKFFAGAIEESIPAQERALRLSPHDPNIASWYWRIGMVHLLQSRIDDAVLWTERAHRANPQLAGPRAWLASACALRGETERAEVELARAIELSADRRYASIARFKNAQRLPAKLELMAESTFFAGLRKAGVPDE
jgi:adenylate cyclase